MSVSVLVKATGHPESLAALGDLDYLSEPTSRGNWQFDLLTAAERHQLLGKNRRIFAAKPDGKIIRVPATTIQITGADGVTRERRTGTISEPYLAHLNALESQGYQIFQRVVIGIKPLTHDHGYRMASPRGAIVPITWTAQVRAHELGLTAALPARASMSILGRVLRDHTRLHVLRKRTVKTMTGAKKVARTIAGHNLVIAPSPSVLARIKSAGLPVDKVLETAARRVLEQMERKRGAQIVAVASTHIQDSSGIRPHLHFRLSAYDTSGKYISLFNRKLGNSRGGRCVMQDEIERQILRIIERRDRPRERN
jgi:hypothetical protein